MQVYNFAEIQQNLAVIFA